MLEQRISQQYMDGLWSKSTYHLSDDEGSDIVDMSEIPEGHEGQDDDWDCQFEAASPRDEPLDWGSDLEDTEVCVPSTSSLLPVHKPPASHQPPRGLRSLKDGSCNYALPVEHKLSDYICEHGLDYALCLKCKGKNQGKCMWLLDSGASAHFTYSKHDFIEYETIAPNERIPVRTASDTIYVEGKGAVLVEHYEYGHKLVVTCLYPVLHILKITTRLLSMGEFLQQRLRVQGDSRSISLYNKNKKMLTCKPLTNGQTTYWLDGSPAELQESQSIYSADYELIHRCLGHPSRDVMSHARNNMNGFPSDVQIPTKAPVCPGCAQ